ncbi:MAG: S8 family serine peptidase [Deferribacteres bacterium]|nr:S8 family serine peptidase [Deferribacteres bacterium]
MEKAWDLTNGSSTIDVGIIDTGGFNRNHTDLSSKFTSNGDLTSSTGFPQHGTEVAGVVAAETDNTTGIASLGWNIKMTSYQFVDQIYENVNDNRSLAYEIQRAINDGVDIINCSFGTIEFVGSCVKSKNYGEIQDLIQDAIDVGIIVVAATGNTNPNPPGPCDQYFPYVPYPAGYSGVIGITATNPNDDHPTGYNHEDLDSPLFIDVAAPGIDILTTVSTGYGFDSGTSFASPLVTALVGLLKTINSSLDKDDVVDILKTTAEKVGQYSYSNGRNKYLGHGRINAYEALKYTLENYGGTLSGEVLLTEDLNIQNGATLTIAPGTIVKFAAQGVDLWINDGAKLDAVGTPSQPITFTSAQANPGRKSWGTIFLHTSNNRLEHCTVEYGDWGIKVYGYPSTSSGNVIKDCTTRNNDQGVRIQNTTVTVENTTIEDNRHAFVILSNSTSTLTGNSVSENDRDGIYSSNAVIDLFSNLFEDNGLGNSSTYHGIYAGSGDDVSFGSRTFSSNPNTAGGFNTIRSNHGAGIFVASSATVTAGIVSGGTSYLAGNNSIHSNGTQTGTSYTGKDFYNVNSTTQMAENNYWGGNCPPAASQIYGSVDTDYCLTTSPTGLSPMPKPAMLAESNGPIDLDTQTKQAIIDQNKQIIVSQPNTQAAVDALQQYYSFVRTDEQNKLDARSGMYDELDAIYKQHSKLDLGKTALQLMILESQRIGDFVNAIALSETALTEVSPADRSGMQFNLILLYLHDVQLSNAQNLLADFKSRYPKELTAIEILQSTVAKAPELYAVTGTKVQSAASPAAGQAASHSSEAAATGEVLFESYPNPFNPATELRFRLPSPGTVRLAIYDILGKQVKLIFDGRTESVEQRHRWQAVDGRGAPVSSGVYFAMLEARLDDGRTLKSAQKLLYVR